MTNQGKNVDADQQDLEDADQFYLEALQHMIEGDKINETKSILKNMQMKCHFQSCQKVV